MSTRSTKENVPMDVILAVFNAMEGGEEEMLKFSLSGLVEQSELEEVTNGDVTHMIIQVQVGDSVPEWIINPAVNIPGKIDYYKAAYNEDLTLKANPDIKIVSYGFSCDMREWDF